MKNITDYSKAVQKVWIAHETLLRLGFDPEDIYISRHREPVAGRLIDTLGCTLRTQDKEFVINCEYYPKLNSIEKVLLEWGDFVRNLKHIPDEDLDSVYAAWPFPQSRTEFVIALVRKGFILPAIPPKGGKA